MLTVKLSVAKTTTNEKTGEVQTVKGGSICVYGLNTRFPVALYPNQWRELAPYMPAILAFIDEQEELGNIVEREQVSTTGRTALAAIDPVVAALMASKSIDQAEATRIAKQSGLIK